MNDVTRKRDYLRSVVTLQRALMALDDKKDVDELTTHHFADGVYMRELLIPAGNVCVGKMHRKEQLNILLRGTLIVATENGSEEMTGPCIIKSPAGVKRSGYALTDTVWLTIHGNEDNEADLEKLEARYIVPEVEVLEMAGNKLEQT